MRFGDRDPDGIGFAPFRLVHEVPAKLSRIRLPGLAGRGRFGKRPRQFRGKADGVTDNGRFPDAKNLLHRDVHVHHPRLIIQADDAVAYGVHDGFPRQPGRGKQPGQQIRARSFSHCRESSRTERLGDPPTAGKVPEQFCNFLAFSGVFPLR
jgi:hypothetical protein